MFKRIIFKFIREISLNFKTFIYSRRNPYLLNESILVKDISNINFNIERKKSYTPFDVFGFELNSDDILKNDEIIWYCDFINNGYWYPKWHLKVPYYLKEKSDIKVPWELGRGHLFLHLLINGIVYDKTYFEITNKCINDFDIKNKVGFGVQWKCPMDVSIRLVNLILVFFIKGDRLAFRTNILTEHYLFIKDNLEIYDNNFTNNHYLSNIMALIWYNIFIISDDEYLFWLIEEFESEIYKQFYSSGGNFEGSTSYHLLSTEIIILTWLAIRYKGFSFRENTIILIDKIIKFCDVILVGDFYCRFGDDDSGFVIRPFNLTNNRFELARCRKNFIANYNIFKNTDICKYKLLNVVFSLLGIKSDFNQSKKYLKSENKVDVFVDEDFGLSRLRFDSNFLFIRHVNKLGCNGRGGHNHNDDLSVEVYFDNKKLVSSSGTYCYTFDCKERNKYRSTISQNSILIDGEEQFYYDETNRGIFELSEIKRNKNIVYDQVELVSTNKLKVRSNRYSRNVSRTVSVDNNFIILDEVDNADAYSIFHFDSKIDTSEILSGKIYYGTVTIVFSGFEEIYIYDDFVSDFYLCKSRIIVIKVKFKKILETKFWVKN